MNKPPKPDARLTGGDIAWIKSYQKSARAKIDGVIGRETLWYLRRDVEQTGARDGSCAVDAAVFALIGGIVGFFVHAGWIAATAF